MFRTTILRSLLARIVPVAQAHCDTADGPAVTDGRRALDTGNLNHALKWIPASGEAELQAVFDDALAVRTTSPAAARVSDRLFLETLVRLHRMGEGVGFTGIQAPGAPVDPVVSAADRALAAGDDGELRGLTADERWPELHRRFEEALARRDFDVDDVNAGREYLAAYVNFFHYAEGHDHEHTHDSELVDGHGKGHVDEHAHPHEHAAAR